MSYYAKGNGYIALSPEKATKEHIEDMYSFACNLNDKTVNIETMSLKR